ncbi:MAG: Na+/H+ antiporter subunit E [Pseudomonadota bacterium]
MNIFAINLLVAVMWAMLSGEITLTTLGTGFVIGFAALWLLQSLFGRDAYFLRLPRLVWLVISFLWALIRSSWRVAHDVVTPRARNNPGVIAVPIRTRNETETLLLSSMISLTPGSLTLDLDETGETLFVHAMFAEDADAVRADIHETLETPLLEALS